MNKKKLKKITKKLLLGDPKKGLSSFQGFVLGGAPGAMVAKGLRMRRERLAREKKPKRRKK